MVYRLLSLLLYPIWMLHAIKHGGKHAQPDYLALRRRGPEADSVERIWVHAASVGEVRAVSPLVRMLRDRGEAILMTSFTATGLQAIRKRFGDDVASGVIPIDHWRPCRRFFARHPIKIGLIMETELWPELLYQARRHDVPLLLINARLSRKSLQTGAVIRAILKRTLAYFERILARNEQDREAFCSLGADHDRIDIVGNLKTHLASAQTHKRLIERDYLILASSHADEEQLFLEARPPGLRDILLVLAPRHPDRSASLQTRLERLRLNFAVRSKAQAVTAETEVYLADTLGELKPFMAHARIVVMGGSFESTGGHNLIEPASLGCAIITGPSDTNIVDDIEMLGQGRGVLQVDDMQQCWREISDLLEQPERAQALGREARSRLAREPDVVSQYLAALEPWL